MIVMPVYSLFTTNPGSFDGLMTNTAWIVNLYTRAMVDIIYTYGRNVNHKI